MYILAVSKVCVWRHMPELTEDSYVQRRANTGCWFYPTISSLTCRLSSTPLLLLWRSTEWATLIQRGNRQEVTRYVSFCMRSRYTVLLQRIYFHCFCRVTSCF